MIRPETTGPALDKAALDKAALDKAALDEAALDEAARELQAAEHDVRVAFDCIALGELDRAHTHALTARVAADAAVTALAAALNQADQVPPET
jgi:hypothetical protein